MKFTRKGEHYTMAMLDDNTAEITMYGEIVERRPRNWWTDEPVEGDFIVQEEFLRDLESIAGASSVTIRMSSLGGDAGVSILIHNRLRELAANGTALTCIVDGVAMSGGSLIMCACDTVKVNPSSLVMIHKCWGLLWGAYNADELREEANSYDAWDKAQVSIYKRKTGLSDTVISHMMSATTYMTGEEAVEKGFADEIIENAEPLEIAASADGRSLLVRGKPFRLAPGMFAPDNIPTVEEGNAEIPLVGSPEFPKLVGRSLREVMGKMMKVNSEASVPVETNTNSPGKTGSEGGNSIMTLEEFQAENPEAVLKMEASATEKERKRLEEIDAVAEAIDPAMVQEAKYGKTACSAQELAYRAALASAQKGQTFLNNLNADNQASGVQKVQAVMDTAQIPDNRPKTPQERMAEAESVVKTLFHGKEGN